MFNCLKEVLLSHTLIYTIIALHHPKHPHITPQTHPSSQPLQRQTPSKTRKRFSEKPIVAFYK